MNKTRRRRIPYNILLLLLCLLFLWRLFDMISDNESASKNWWARGRIGDSSILSGTRQPLPQVILAPGSKVAIINIAKFHHEVYPAFHYAFQRAGYVTRSYAYNDGGNITDGLKDWNFTMTGLRLIFCPDILCDYELVVFTSWENIDDFELSLALMEMGCVKNFVFVIHNAEERMLPLLEQAIRYNVSIELYTLGPHTAETMKGLLDGHDNIHLREILISYFIPIFPFKCADEPNSTAMPSGLQGPANNNLISTEEDKNLTTFSIQGLFSPLRRNYTKLFLDLVEHKDDIPNHFRLVVLGSGTKLPIPKSIKSIVRRVNGRPYCIYNGFIRDSIGLLTSFASDIYYKTKASSSVASSLINQVPLLTSNSTIRVYNYVSPSSAWIKRRNQSDVEAILDILALPDLNEQIIKRKKSIADDVLKAHQHNHRMITRSVSRFRERTSRFRVRAQR